jgi:hypothetical protein
MNCGGSAMPASVGIVPRATPECFNGLFRVEDVNDDELVR